MTPMMLNWILIGVIGISMLIGFMRGFLATLISTIVWAITVFAMISLNDWLAWFISKWSFLASTSNLIAGVVVLVLILLIGHVIVNVFNFTGNISQVSLSSRLWAVLIGVVRGILCVVAIVFVANMTAINAKIWWNESQIVQSLEPWIQAIHAVPILQTGIAQQPLSKQSHYPQGSI